MRLSTLITMGFGLVSVIVAAPPAIANLNRALKDHRSLDPDQPNKPELPNCSVDCGYARFKSFIPGPRGWHLIQINPE
jgi:hypothetical protein